MIVKPAKPKSVRPPRPGLSPEAARLAGAHSQIARATSAAVLAEARSAGLFNGDKTQHVSFRAPKALVEAAMRESGVSTPTDLGVLALAMLAQPDPVSAFMKQTRGALGADHELDY